MKNVPAKKKIPTKKKIPMKKKAPTKFPLVLGKFRNETSKPWLGQDCWTQMVNKKDSIFLRPKEKGFPSVSQMTQWLNMRKTPVNIILNSSHARSYPPSDWDPKIINHKMVKTLYVANPTKIHSKIYPIPVGLKWQFKSTNLFGESKAKQILLYRSVASSPEECKRLFSQNSRSLAIWLRPYKNTNAKTTYYRKSNKALQTPRSEIQKKIKSKYKMISTHRMNAVEYFQKLKKVEFVVSPAGKGLDTHCTWEALLAGCIPIVPHSTLDPVFADLPVWLINDWVEVTDAAAERISRDFRNRDTWNFEKLFTPWWEKKINTVS